MALSQSHSSPPIYRPLPFPPPISTPSPTGGQGKPWCFTLNNWTAGDILMLRDLGSSQITSYLIFGQEVAASGTPHLQGFVKFATNKRFNAVRDLLPFGAHVALRLRQSTDWHAAEYCKKDGLFEEFGDPPAPSRGHAGGRATAEKWTIAKRAAKEGNLDQIDDDLFIKYYSTFKRIAKDYMKKPDPLGTVCGLWIHGATGQGKSHSVITQHPDR